MDSKRQSIEVKDNSINPPKKSINIDVISNSGYMNSKFAPIMITESKEISTNISITANQINSSKSKIANKSNKKERPSKSPIKNAIPKRKAKFRQGVFIDMVDVESYKKYNAQNVFQEPWQKTHCKCCIF